MDEDVDVAADEAVVEVDASNVDVVVDVKKLVNFELKIAGGGGTTFGEFAGGAGATFGVGLIVTPGAGATLWVPAGELMVVDTVK